MCSSCIRSHTAHLLFLRDIAGCSLSAVLCCYSCLEVQQQRPITLCLCLYCNKPEVPPLPFQFQILTLSVVPFVDLNSLALCAILSRDSPGTDPMNQRNLTKLKGRVQSFLCIKSYAMKKDFFNSFPPLFSISHLVEMGLLARDSDSHSRKNEQGREKNPSERNAEVLEVSVTWRFQKENTQLERIGSSPKNKPSVGRGVTPSSALARNKDFFIKAAAQEVLKTSVELSPRKQRGSVQMIAQQAECWSEHLWFY